LNNKSLTEIALHILDIVQNSIVAGAKNILIEINEDKANDIMEISVIDNGKGIASDKIERVLDPFYTSRTTRKVGLGLSLFKQSVEQAEGSFYIDSELGKGTKVRAIYKLSHLDRPPLGDIAGVVSLMVSANPNLDFVFKNINGPNNYIFNTTEVKQTLGEISVSNPEVQKFMKEMIEENINNIQMC
jgi:anti-sigma regulatory factor (Ser/Thr protein kinase)